MAGAQETAPGERADARVGARGAAAPDRPGDAVALLGPAEVRELAASLGIRPTKRLGQNFVIDPNTIRRIVAQAGIGADDHVVEVGPGLGSLTLGLFEVCDDVTVVEIDPALAEALPRTIAARAPGHMVRVIAADAATLTAETWRTAWADHADPAAAGPTAVVANLPYNVAVPILLHLLETFPTIRRVLVMVQAEVAERVAAAPGGRVYGVPSVKAAWYGVWRLAGTVGTHVFWPAPNVTSALLAGEIRPTAERPGDEALRRRTFALVDAAFAQRRKTLRQSLSGVFGSPAAAETALTAAGVDPRARAERLGVAEFAGVARIMTR
jgi:16S rRNA (adenine1518-N6/adenine1519-N6)-dimethyltransferase